MKVNEIKEKGFNIEFVYSPLFEVLCSLHVLAKPDHHMERIKWAEQMKLKMTDKLYKELIEFGGKTDEWLAVMDFCNFYEECNDFNIMSSLNFLEDLKLRDFNKALIKNKLRSFDKKSKLIMLRSIKEYYINYFDNELRFIEPLLVRNLKRQSEICVKEGIYKFASEIHNRIEVTDKAFLFHKYTLFTAPFKEIKNIIIRISSFVAPHLLMDIYGDTVQFTIALHLTKGIDEVPLDLLKLIKALGDDTRLKIVKKLYSDKYSTQELAKELKFTEACISKHLKILYDAGLLHKERCGNYMYYYLSTYLIDRIPMGIYEYLNS